MNEVEVETGVWCEKCLLPSALAMSFTLVSEGRTLGSGRFQLCPDCEGQSMAFDQ